MIIKKADQRRSKGLRKSKFEGLKRSMRLRRESRKRLRNEGPGAGITISAKIDSCKLARLEYHGNGNFTAEYKDVVLKDVWVSSHYWSNEYPETVYDGLLTFDFQVDEYYNGASWGYFLVDLGIIEDEEDAYIYDDNLRYRDRDPDIDAPLGEWDLEKSHVNFSLGKFEVVIPSPYQSPNISGWIDVEEKMEVMLEFIDKRGEWAYYFGSSEGLAFDFGDDLEYIKRDAEYAWLHYGEEEDDEDA